MSRTHTLMLAFALFSGGAILHADPITYILTLSELSGELSGNDFYDTLVITAQGDTANVQFNSLVWANTIASGNVYFQNEGFGVALTAPFTIFSNAAGGGGLTVSAGDLLHIADPQINGWETGTAIGPITVNYALSGWSANGLNTVDGPLLAFATFSGTLTLEADVTGSGAPEPAPIAMLAAALTGLAVYRRRGARL